MTAVTTSGIADREITSSAPGYRFSIALSGYRFTAEPRPALTDDESQAFAESGGEQAFYDNVEQLRIVLDSHFLPEA